ncbi:hypothetical protein OG874_24565 [Nocardia sp. NBC_00565]|uniref:hypothetical protein n=1 Tax=Nocardia sp. NBC_00565 TaxID=2975993 RepID=UPI002E81F84A|nr:hypothetical protein [Nocardia sp. NBC_00565]WUC00079.1 hypothetical protein OG874_24565 [Nocardia sp. NBC_00565]
MEQALVVVVPGRHAHDIEATQYRRQTTELHELPTDPLGIVGVVGFEFACAAQDILASDKFHIEPALSLATKQIEGATEDDDESVASVDCFGDYTGEVGSFAGLDVADDKAFRLVGIDTGGVRETFDDAIGSDVER